jgi:hypothetical protein
MRNVKAALDDYLVLTLFVVYTVLLVAHWAKPPITIGRSAAERTFVWLFAIVGRFVQRRRLLKHLGHLDSNGRGLLLGCVLGGYVVCGYMVLRDSFKLF